MSKQIVTVPLLGERQIRTARKPGPCAGWTQKGGHTTIEAGDQYWESELDMDSPAAGFAMQRCCMDCLPEGVLT